MTLASMTSSISLRQQRNLSTGVGGYPVEIARLRSRDFIGVCCVAVCVCCASVSVTEWVPHITASAAEDAVSAICDEYQFLREIFDDDDTEIYELGLVNWFLYCFRALQYIYFSYRVSGKIHHKECFTSDRLIYQMRAATATALGGGAARAKLLADQEDREIQSFVATIIAEQRVYSSSNYWSPLFSVSLTQPRQMQNFPREPFTQVALRIFLHLAMHAGRVHVTIWIANADSTRAGARTKTNTAIAASIRGQFLDVFASIERISWCLRLPPAAAANTATLPAGVDVAYNDSYVSDEDGVVEDVNGMCDEDGGRTFDEDGRRKDGRRMGSEDDSLSTPICHNAGRVTRWARFRIGGKTPIK
ncbi:hypothetical protein RHMOL_Rhmol08G0262700 [Rhododendron molle]|uniref:Uncharacterized protein n=1 Tax=Rhododendron molle TaxID=49168 RepID=A0ACC0MSW1_RHOML|nr:hypothetical protein RHMOL_Rhmol08G0262700 [Rhododendron molle]